MDESKEFCTKVPSGQKSAVMALTVNSHDAVSVSFPIIPIKLGKVSIKVSAAAQLFSAVHEGLPLDNEIVSSDVVLRSILVVVTLMKF